MHNLCGVRRAARSLNPRIRPGATPPAPTEVCWGAATSQDGAFHAVQPRLTGTAPSPSPSPSPCRAPGARDVGTTSANRGRSSPRAAVRSGERLACSPGSGGRCKEKARRTQAACVGGLEQRGFGRRRVPSSRSILRSFRMKNKAGRFSKPNTGLERLQREVDDLVCATHALKIIIKRVKNEK